MLTCSNQKKRKVFIPRKARIVKFEMENFTSKLESKPVEAFKYIIVDEGTDMNQDWLIQRLYPKIKKYLLQPDHGLPINPRRLQYNRREDRWHLRERDKDSNNIYNVGFTVPDFILHVDDMLGVVKITSCWFDYIPDRYSYCVDKNSAIQDGEIEENDRAEYKIVSCEVSDIIESRSLEKAEESRLNLSRAIQDQVTIQDKAENLEVKNLEVKALSMVCTFDFDARRVERIMLKGK